MRFPPTRGQDPFQDDRHLRRLGRVTRPVQGGSTDVADVSHITPTVGLKVATNAIGTPGHSWAVTSCSGTDAGVKGAVVAAKVMAATGIDLLLDAELRKNAREDFLKRTDGKPYQCPVPQDQAVPLPKDSE